jgi:hypothetical protein
LSSALAHHLTLRPVYENPPIAAATWSYDFVEVFAKVFMIRCSKVFAGSFKPQAMLWLLWAILLVGEQCVSLYFVHVIFSGGVVVTVNDTTDCTGWFPDIFGWMAETMDFTALLEGDGSMRTIFSNTPVFTALLALNLFVNLVNLLYLWKKKINDSQFPAVAAYHIWSECFFRRTQTWVASEITQEQLDWLEKFTVLTLLPMSDFKLYIPKHPGCGGREKLVRWKKLAQSMAGEFYPLDLQTVVDRTVQGQPMSEDLVEFVEFVYSLPGCGDTLKQLTYFMVSGFEESMTAMTSSRISIMCQILDIDPAVKSPMKN